MGAEQGRNSRGSETHLIGAPLTFCRHSLLCFCAKKNLRMIETRMISGWKIRRELTRLGQQVRGLYESFTDPAVQRRLDSVVAAGLPQIDGALPETSKVALYLIFQPGGLSDSTLETCRWLAAAGYAPLVVSNAPILSEDRDRLAAVVWRAVERPNIGYDFGGYRDGLTCLEQWAVAPDEVLILNDSVWLPMLPETDLLDRLSAHPAEVAGTILRTRGEVRFLESYLYRLNRAALTHPGFAAFWAGIRLTSNKYHVIRRGERGFSAEMLAAGLNVAGIYNSAALAEKIAEQDDGFLRLTLRYAAYIDASLASERDQLVAGNGPEWRIAALEHVERVLVKRQGYSSFPYAMMRLMDYPLLKKSADPVSRAWRMAYLAAVGAGDLPKPSNAILAEIRGRDS